MLVPKNKVRKSHLFSKTDVLNQFSQPEIFLRT
jgi:hypothetical protein